MRRSFLRHEIIGTEVGQPRPPAYMRRGRTRRTRSPKSRRGSLVFFTLVAATVLLFVVIALRSNGIDI